MAKNNQKNKPVTDQKERRVFDVNLRMDGGEGETPGHFVGEAALYNSESEDLGGFIEIIEPGFFDEAIEDSDARCLINHDNNLILGRQASGTLALELTDTGLNYDCENPGTSYANDLAISIGRNDVNQSSFGFTIKREYNGDDMDGDRWEYGPDGIWRRFLIPNGCKRIYDVSPVTFPAYPETSAAQRSLKIVEEKRQVTPPAKLINRSQNENRLRLLNIQ